MEKENIFRKKNLERLASPEDLGDYIKIAKPRIWVTLGALVALLIAGILWACFYTITRTVDATGYVYEQNIYVYVSANDYGLISAEDEVRADGNTYSVTQKSGIYSGSDIYAAWAERGLSEANVAVYTGVVNSADEYYGEIIISAEDLADGGSAGVSIIYEEISPIRLVIGG